MTINNIFSNSLECTAYIRGYGPDRFPEEHKTTLAREFEELNTYMSELLNRVRNEDKRRWLEMAKREIDKARNFYMSHARDDGYQALFRADEYLTAAREGKQHKIDFIAGPGGSLKPQ